MKCGTCPMFDGAQKPYDCPVGKQVVNRQSQCPNLEGLATILEGLSDMKKDDPTMTAHEREIACLWAVAIAAEDVPAQHMPESLDKALRELDAEIEKNDKLKEMMEAKKDGD